MPSHRFDPQDDFDEIEPDEVELAAFDQDEDGPRVERMRRQTGKPGVNQERRQRDKEWGRSMFKFQKQRNRNGGKP